MGFVGNDEDGFCSTPKLPLFSYYGNRAYETPGLATPPVNIAGSVPFLWEEAPGKPRTRKPPRPNQTKDKRGLHLPPRLEATANEPSPTTVLDGPYDLRRRSLSLPRSASVIRKLRGVPGPAPAEEQRLFRSSRWGSFSKCKEALEGSFDFLRSGCDGRSDWSGGGSKVHLYNVERRKGNLFHTTNSNFWARVYQGFKQVIPWRRNQENLKSRDDLFH